MLTNEHSDKGQSCKDEFIVTEEEHAEKSEPKAYEEECTPKPWLKWPTQVTINTISTVFIAVFTGTLWVTSCNQLDSMREQTKTMQAQLAEMQSGSADTKAIAESAKTQAEATGRIAEATRSSVAQGKAAMDTTLEALRMDQRAWVGPSNIRIITLEVGKPIQTEIIVTNTGKPPARKMELSQIVVRASKPFDLDEWDFDKAAMKLHVQRTNTTLFPNGFRRSQSETSDVLEQGELSQMLADKADFYLIAKVE